MATVTENPLLEGLQLRRTPDPCAVVIFGASGDLTKKKLFPALYSLAFRRLLPDKFAIVGVARTEETDEEFKARMKEAVQEHGRVEETLTKEVDAARKLLDDLANAGIDYDDVVKTLEQEGVQKFADSFEELLEGIRAKRGELAHA